MYLVKISRVLFSREISKLSKLLSFDSRTNAPRNHWVVKLTDNNCHERYFGVLSFCPSQSLYLVISKLILFVALDVRCRKWKWGMDYSFLSFSHSLSFITFFSRAKRVHSFGVLEIPFGGSSDTIFISLVAVEAVLSREEIFPSKSLISRPNNNRPHVIAASCIYAEPSSFLIFTLRGQLRLGMASTRLLSSRFALCHRPRPRLQSYCIDEGKLLSMVSRSIDDHKLPREQYLQSRLGSTIVNSSWY